MIEGNILKTILLALFLTFGLSVLQAQGLKPTDSLYKEILHMDSVLFDAFNNRDLATFEKTFSTNLEFYHDKGGLTDLTFTLNSLKNTAAQNSDLRRELVPGSMQVYPIKGFGAIQIAAHRFCHTEGGRQDCGTFQFTNVWKKTAEGWKLLRVLSYGH